MGRLERDSQPPWSVTTGGGGFARGVIAVGGKGGDVIEGDVIEGDVTEGDVIEGDVIEGDVIINHIREYPPSSSP
jgi:hypothetical protein